MIAEIDSITNLKIYEQSINLFKPGNTPSLSEKSIKEKRLLLCVTFSFGSTCKYWIYAKDDIGLFTILSNL